MNIDLYIKAINFAALAHAGQTVPGKPYCYLTHITSVVVEIMAAISEIKYANADLAIQCAILHDILEDTDVTTVALENEFGLSVCKGVMALTKNKKITKSKRIFDIIERILKEPPEIGMVKMADRICNLQEPPDHWFEDKISEYHEEAIVIYNSLGHLNSKLADRLKAKIEEYKNYF
ncbi:MAG: HD domain-containing protein [Spirochaetota bacterium]